MTHIDNLASILENGLLSHNNPYRKRDISDQSVNARRQRIEPIYQREIHDYVPFYFNIKNPMLWVVQKEYGDDIVILGFCPNLLIQDELIFTNRNASTKVVKFSNDIADIENKSFIDFDRVYETQYTEDKDSKQIRQAEILIPSKAPSSFIKVIYVQNEQAKEKVKDILNKRFSLLSGDVEKIIEIKIEPELFFDLYSNYKSNIKVQVNNNTKGSDFDDDIPF